MPRWKMFISMTEADLKNNGYCCSFREEKIRCKNIKLHYGIGKEECRFNVTEHVVEFDWYLKWRQLATN